jgi:hypothetical protein
MCGWMVITWEAVICFVTIVIKGKMDLASGLVASTQLQPYGSLIVYFEPC